MEVRWQLATDLIADVRDLDLRIAPVEARRGLRSSNPRPACYYRRKRAEGGLGRALCCMMTDTRWPVRPKDG